ncbi:MAG: dual specificity protein phosphatase family protein [Myxococcota bacterium]|nr:dual specificity protein phosphatase family protein [Myxococcota bacterium]
MITRYTDLDDQLAVGSHPHAPEHMQSLARDHGVSSVICLQSDDDLASRGLRWPVLWQFYVGLGIDAVRVPITDFDKRDLLAHLDEGVEAVHRAVESGGKVYVHCTAGLNRSPTTLIAYLVKHREMTLDDALTWVTERHDCVPYPDVVETWLQRAS